MFIKLIGFLKNTTVNGELNFNNVSFSKLNSVSSIFDDTVANNVSVENWNFQESAKTMACIFCYARELTGTLDISTWNTSNITNLYKAFGSRFSNLTYLNINNLDFSNAINFNSLFYNNTRVSDIDFSTISFPTSIPDEVYTDDDDYAALMFRSTSGSDLDLSSLSEFFEAIHTMNSMFNNANFTGTVIVPVGDVSGKSTSGTFSSANFGTLNLVNAITPTDKTTDHDDFFGSSEIGTLLCDAGPIRWSYDGDWFVTTPCGTSFPTTDYDDIEEGIEDEGGDLPDGSSTAEEY